MAQALRRGNRGPEVRRLQELLNRRLHAAPPLGIDGEFGERTDAAVRLYQATLGLGIDGVVGPRTWAALESGVVLRPVAHAGASSRFPDAPWMAVALREVGQSEVPGAASNPRILEYDATTTLRATTDETPWCSSFVNWSLRQVGVVGTNSAWAASWLGWGRPDLATPGAVTVIYNAAAARSISVSGNHVAFLVELTASHFVTLGGNQSNQVKISRFPRASWQAKGYRWPR